MRDRLGVVGEGLQRQHRPEDLLAQDLGARWHVDEQRRLVVEAAERRRHAAAARQTGARRPRRARRSRRRGRGARGWISGPTWVPGSRGSPSRIAAILATSRVGELGVDRPLHEQPRAGQADLPGVVVLAGRRLDRQVEIGVVADDERRLPSQFEAHRREMRRGRGADGARGRRRTGERDAAHAGRPPPAPRRPRDRVPARR